MTPQIPASRTAIAVRSLAAGALMGLANLVPGVSGGTMLLAVGVYPQCIDAIAKLTVLRPDRAAILLLASVAASAATVVLLLAGVMKGLVLDYRWVMYSLFLGSTVGGVPVLLRMIGRPDRRCWAGAVTGLALMALTLVPPEDMTGGGPSPMTVVFLAGFGAFAAMLLPGLSGGYILLLSGQYVPVLSAVDSVRAALLNSGGIAWPVLTDAASVLGPFALGCLTALAGVTNLIKFLLRAHRPLMLGFLLGLVAGAVLGLWPFKNEDSRFLLPGAAQAAVAAGIATGGFLITRAISRISGQTAGG